MKMALINLAAAALTRQRRRSLTEVTEEVHRLSRPEPAGHRLDEIRRIRAVIDSLHRISTSRNRYLESDLDVISP
jgi:hypothetical protein